MCFKFVYHHMKSFAHHVIIYLIFAWMNACIVIFYSILGQFFFAFFVYSTLKYHKSLSSCWLNSAWLQYSCQLIQRDITHSKWISPGKESMLEHKERVCSCIFWTWSLAAAAASIYEFDEILEVCPLIISVALESASLGQGHVFRCIESNLISSFGLKLFN